jgi:cysteinyl-tRNA synthetase
MHNGFLNVEGEKMSKSLGNFVTIHDLLKDWPGDVLRLNMLRTHYRQPMDWTVSSLEQSRKALQDWLAVAVPMSVGNVRPDQVPARSVYPPVLDALSDDLNTPKVIAELHSLRNGLVHGAMGQNAVVALSDTLRFLGLLHDEVADALERIRPKSSLSNEEIADAIEVRNAARSAKDFNEADRIRDELLDKGIALKDGPAGTTWEVKR